MAQQVLGNLVGLKASQTAQLARLYRRRVPSYQIFTYELAEQMTAAAWEIDRPVAVLINRSGHDIPLARISDVSYEKGLLDRLLGCGTLVVSDASDRGRVALPDVPRVEEKQLMLSDLLYQGTKNDDGA